MDLERAKAAAEEAARRAGELIRTSLGRVAAYETKSNAHDLVTEVDRRSEAIIGEVLRSAFPDVPVVGEEAVAADPSLLEELPARPWVWVVDPLDGTTNFVHGLTPSSVSIALARRGDPVVGVVYDPYRDEIFTAVAGRGATGNGAPLRVDGTVRLADALLATGFPTQGDARRANVAGLRALSAVVRNLRAYGSAALHLAYVACGRLTGFWELQLNPWDLAAGALLVREAGGRVTDTLGRPYTLATRHVVATSGRIHDEVLYLLREAGATGFVED